MFGVKRKPLPIQSVKIAIDSAILQQNIEGSATGIILLKLSESVERESNINMVMTEGSPEYLSFSGSKREIKCAISKSQIEYQVPFNIIYIPESETTVEFNVEIKFPKDRKRHKYFVPLEKSTFEIKFKLLSPYTRWGWGLKFKEDTKEMDESKDQIFLDTLYFEDLGRKQTIPKNKLVKLFNEGKFDIEITNAEYWYKKDRTT